MGRFRKLIIYSFLIGIFQAVTPLRAQSLSSIQDTVSIADGSKFNGVAIVSWQSFTAANGAAIAPHSTSINIVNGYLSVVLVPTTNASDGAYYTVKYESNDGTTIWTEYWQVPPSWTPLTLSQVRVASPPASGSSGGGSTISLPITESNVVNLLSDLAARPLMSSSYSALHAVVTDASGNLASASGNASDCVHVDGSTGACGAPAAVTITTGFVDGESPTGTVNGTNLTFVLSQTPAPSTSLSLYRNGLAIRQGLDYTLSGNTITFVQAAAPQSGDILQAFYRVTGTAVTVTFADGESPAGVVNGTNAAFTLVASPSPGASLQLFRNGSLLRQGADYLLSANTVTFTSGSIPRTGDILTAFYRH